MENVIFCYGKCCNTQSKKMLSFVMFFDCRPSSFSLAPQGEATVSGLTEGGEKVTSDDRSEGSMTSISSGFSSLNRKGRLDSQAPGK